MKETMAANVYNGTLPLYMLWSYTLPLFIACTMAPMTATSVCHMFYITYITITSVGQRLPSYTLPSYTLFIG